MRISVFDAFERVKQARGMPSGADFKITSQQTGLPINRKIMIEVKSIRRPISDLPDSTRVASFNREVQKLIGAQVGAKVQLFLNGKPVDGRLSIGKLS